MQEVDYRSSPYPVREDLVEAQRLAWRRLAAPGAFLDGARRIEVAREVRNARDCGLCRRRLAALSPAAVDGAHDAAGGLTPAETEAVHRIATDPGRLSRGWLAGLLADGLGEEDYVEIVSIVASVMVMDTFRRALGLPVFDLPAPEAGRPSFHSAPGARAHNGWVRLVQPEDVRPEDGAVYDGPLAAPVVKALSLVPEAKRAYWQMAEVHYLPNAEMGNFKTRVRAVDRMQMELVASRVSALHQCVY